MIGKTKKKNKLAPTFDGYGSAYGDYWLKLWISATTGSFAMLIERDQCRSISNIYSFIYKLNACILTVFFN